MATDATAAGEDELRAESSASGIAGLCGFRVFLGNEQWQVRWGAGEETETSWEKWDVLDTDELRRQATSLRDGAK